MPLHTVLLTVLVLVVTSSEVLSYDSCLEQRSSCLRNPDCRRIFESFQHTCGYSLAKCNVRSASDCVYDIQRIREFFPYTTCVCYEALGFTEECDYFRQLIWNHPCERRISDAGIERSLIENNRFVSATTQPTLRRTTRTPVADQVRQWKSQLNGDLVTRDQLRQATCDEALDRVCLQHVSCRQLWKLFRESCGVDQDNQCTASDREVCWQSFEGLSWTGLGNCHCDTDNSDCHWIRLHTNYNKCIYEISKSGQFPSLPNQRENSQQHAQQYQRRYETEYVRQGDAPNAAPYVPPRQPAPTRPMTTPSTTTTTTTTRRPTTTTTTTRAPLTTTSSTTTTTPTPRRRPPFTTRAPIRTAPFGATTVPVWWQTTSATTNAPSRQREGGITVRLPAAQIQYRPLYEESPVTTSPSRFESESPYRQQNYYWYTTATTQKSTVWTTLQPPPSMETEGRRQQYNHGHRDRQSATSSLHKGYNRDDVETRNRGNGQPGASGGEGSFGSTGRSMSATSFRQKIPSNSSSCQSAMAKCESAEDCRWHLGELRVRCASNNCRREDCASALQRFSRFVPPSLVESVMFCQCAAGDAECSREQDLIYPKCLYSSSSPLLTCTQNALRCDADSRCRSLRDSLVSSCPVSDEQCGRSSLANCRKAILAARASPLEQPCFCPLSDMTCLSHQRVMIPNNPCIEKAMFDYARTNSPAHTNRVQDIDQNEREYESPSEKDHKRTYSGEQNTNIDYPAPTKLQPLPTKSSKRPKYKHQTSSSTTTTTTTPRPSIESEQETKKLTGNKSKSKYRTTVEPPTTTESPPPWVTTTPTVATTTTTFMTHAPPPPEGCRTKDASGRPLFVNVGTVIRRYVDWSGRCSSWCECVAEDELTCARLPCLDDGRCEAPLTVVDFGERLFMKDRGACFCESGNFICDFPNEMPETYPGLYLSAGYSPSDVEMLRAEVPSDVLERAGLLSAAAATDIGSRLQIAFERMLPSDLQCRVVLMSEMSEPGSAFFRVEWFGMNEALNHTKTQWHHGWAEKVCSPYVNALADLFAQSDSTRYQLVLSTVKQLKVLDFLDGLPTSTANYLSKIIIFISILLFNCS